MLRLSHARLCSEHFAECDFVNFMAEYQMGFAKSHSLKCLLHKWAWCGTARKSACLNCINLILFHLTAGQLCRFDPFLPHSGSIPRELVHSYALGSLWVVTICCNTVGRHGRAFCRPHAYTFNEQTKMSTALTPQTDVTSEKVTWLMENLRQVSASLQKIKSIKNQHNFFSLHFLFH